MCIFVSYLNKLYIYIFFLHIEFLKRAERYIMLQLLFSPLFFYIVSPLSQPHITYLLKADTMLYPLWPHCQSHAVSGIDQECLLLSKEIHTVKKVFSYAFVARSFKITSVTSMGPTKRQVFVLTDDATKGKFDGRSESVAQDKIGAK